jgi:hypothetical protein
MLWEAAGKTHGHGHPRALKAHLNEELKRITQYEE